jgi:hypothetical protein
MVAELHNGRPVEGPIAEEALELILVLGGCIIALLPSSFT